MLEDLLNDPILDVILDHDRLTRDDLHRVIQEARRTLARVPREWHRDHSGDR
jgi:L-aminopeptidase/D-esterase-like protein